VHAPSEGKGDMKDSIYEELEHIFQAEVFWIVTPCSVVVRYQCFRVLHTEDIGSMDLCNVGILLQHDVVSQPKRPELETSSL
jgi:hypothetical protein